MALQGSEIPASHRFIDIIQSLNARDADAGGYFGNTPYWTLHNQQLWRAVDREFTSVQMYWFALMPADEVASTVAANIIKAVLSEGVTSIKQLEPEQKSQLFGEDILRLTQFLSLGALGFASSKDFNNRRSRGLHEMINSLATDATYTLQTIIGASSSKSVERLKSVLPSSHPLQELPSDSLGLNISVQAALMQLVPLIGITEDMLNMSRTENLINNPREVVPHLLHASM